MRLTTTELRIALCSYTSLSEVEWSCTDINTIIMSRYIYISTLAKEDTYLGTFNEADKVMKHVKHNPSSQVAKLGNYKA